MLAVLWSWFAILLFTHYGAWSPYSYAWGMGGRQSVRLDGAVVHPDAETAYSIFQFFYEPRFIAFDVAHNLIYPLPMFVSGNFAAFTRSYILAHYLSNLLIAFMLSCAAVRLAEQLGVPRLAILVSGLIVASLPMFVIYIGQPMQYIVGPAVSYMILMAVIALSGQGVRDPIAFGLLTAVMTLNYDWYVYVAALLLYFMEVHRFERRKDFAVYVVVSFAPRMLWMAFLRLISHDQISTHFKDTFGDAIMYGWLNVLETPLHNTLFPLVAGHVGLTVGARMTLAMVYWPVLVLVITALCVLKPSVSAFRPAWLAVFLVVFFILEQIGTAVFDWENHPRRAIPVVFAVAFALFYAARELLSRRGWRTAFLVVLALSMYVPMADRITREPLLALFTGGGSANGEVKYAFQTQQLRLTKEAIPELMSDERRPRFGTLPGVTIEPRALWPFLFVQLLLGFLFVMLFRQLARAGLAPHSSPWVVACLLGLSLTRLFF